MAVRAGQSAVAIGDVASRPYTTAARQVAAPFQVRGNNLNDYLRNLALKQNEINARPLMYEKIYNKDVTRPSDAREFVGRAAEAPTYAYTATKGFLGNPAGNLGQRVLSRSTAVLPEAGLQTLIDTGVEGNIKKAPEYFAQNAIGMALLGNTAGLAGDVLKRGKKIPAGLSLEDVSGGKRLAGSKSNNKRHKTNHPKRMNTSENRNNTTFQKPWVNLLIQVS